MNRFSGSANLWRLFGEYETFIYFFYTLRGLRVCTVRGPKIGQNEQIYNNWPLFVHFHYKVGNKINFPVVQIYVVLWENMRPSIEDRCNSLIL